jgi:predicted PurR-regulated permease PerM
VDPELTERTAGERPVASIVDRRIEERRQTATRTLIGTVLVVGILYVGRQVFILIAVAILFAFILRPIVSYLERTFLRRIGAVVVALTLALGILTLGAWALASQVNALAREVAAYGGELEKKLREVSSRPGTIALLEQTLERLARSTEPEEPALAVRIIPDTGFAARYRNYAPTLEFVAAALLVIVLVFFMLHEREGLRDKLLRLAGRAHLTVTTQAIGETTYRISRYLLTFSALNLLFGLLIWVGLVLIGMPHAVLWGVLAGLLRFIPYVGAILSAALPTVLALAVFPGWWVPLGVLGLFVLTDQLMAGFIEPMVVGHRVGISPIALLLAAICWGWLWGPVGLLLATPITVCLTVAGEFIPALRVFSILFAREAPLEGYLSFYNRLLSRDRGRSVAIADHYAEEHSMGKAFLELFIPTLTFAAEELARGRITRAHDHFIKDVIRELIIRLGDRNASASPESSRIVAVSVAHERLSLGTLMLVQLLRAEGYAVDIFTDLSTDEVVEFVRDVQPDALFISCSNPDHLTQAYAELQALRESFPDLFILSGGSAFAGNQERTMAAGASYVPSTLMNGKEEFLREAAKRQKASVLASVSTARL